jgi:filamentous hemagglutinin family protein
LDICPLRFGSAGFMRPAFLWALLPTLLLVLPPQNGTHAQVATNITASALPPCPGPCGVGVTIVTPLPPGQGGTITITGGARPGDGPNLFHSFGRFDVGTGDIANFLNETHLPTSNILSRVTGGNPSQIYGTIRTTDFPGANLFLMNPAGVLFGPGTALDLGAVTDSAVRHPGSFYATTADYLNLGDADGTSPFYADPAQASVLSVAPVVAFGFLGPNAASIAIQGGNLEVPDGQTLSFIGGPRVFIPDPDTGVAVPSGVTMTAGRLSAPNGLIYMETVTAPGSIPLPTLSGNPLGSPVSFPGSENAVIYVQSGELVMKGASLLTATTGPTSGEPIGIDVEVAGQFTMQNASALSSSTTGEGQAGAINVSASTLAMDGAAI